MTDIVEEEVDPYLNPYDESGDIRSAVSSNSVRLPDGSFVETPFGTVAVKGYDDPEKVCEMIFSRAREIAQEVLSVTNGDKNPVLVMPLNGGFLPTMMVYRELIALNPFVDPKIALFVPESNAYLYMPEGVSDIFVTDDIIDSGGLAKKVKDAKPEGSNVHLHALSVKHTGKNEDISGYLLPFAWILCGFGMDSSYRTPSKSADADFFNPEARTAARERAAGVLLVPNSKQSEKNRSAVSSGTFFYDHFLDSVSIFKTRTWMELMGAECNLLEHMVVIEGLSKGVPNTIMNYVQDALSRISRTRREP
jgi:hypoxanthine-guanine phosphoribosyltransferase